MADQTWRDWPASERTGGPPATPMSATFFDRWYARKKLLRNRSAVPGVLVVGDDNPPFATDWKDIGEPGEIYVPPWAIAVYAYYRIGVNATIQGWEGRVFVRVKFDEVTQSPFLDLFLYSSFDLGFLETGDKVLYSAIAPFLFSNPLIGKRDSVVTVQWQYKIETDDGGINDLDLYYFANNPTRRLAWYWST